MALERRSPLPPGMYWLDVLGDKRAAFIDWRRANKTTVRVRSTEAFPEPAPGRDWYKFEVLQPTPWEATRFGFPNIIASTDKIDSSADTVQRPDPEKDPLDKLGDALSSAGSVTSQLVPIVVVLGGVLVLTNLWSRSRGR
jgi:hypothetical protein